MGKEDVLRIIKQITGYACVERAKLIRYFCWKIIFKSTYWVSSVRLPEKIFRL